MKNKTMLAIFISLFLSTFVYQTHANKQVHALVRLYNAKLSKASVVDISHFETPKGLHKAKVILPQTGRKENDKIDKLPGQPYVKFDQYGGYVTVNESAGRAFYYYFVEAEKSKESLPLLLWLNGGPGCSSLGYGAMQELGPFRINSDGKTLYVNKFSWNRAANVLFVESPAGVGFSYSNKSSDYQNMGDKSTATDNYMFLLNWLERFPEYKERDFYIAGESYAGHYVPQLAQTIIYYNLKHNKTLINLKGILIGNAVINDETDLIGMFDYLGSHAIISDETAFAIQKYCNFSPNAVTQSDMCIDAAKDVGYNTEAVDIYNIYAPLCFDGNLTTNPKKTSWQNFDPCSDYYTSAYMNRQDVQEALHANVTKLDHDWEACSGILTAWTDSPLTVIPLLEEFMKLKLRIWVFSGDTDARVPITSTKLSISSMKLPIKTKWHPWFHEKEAAGFAQVYTGDITLVTVREAGHQVPSYQPKRALALVRHFISGKPLVDPSRR
ncbi:putative carboxypeptidase D [Helianthus annuus]|uniref:Carboxypeptidase n=1 Tax=Helianthus annuus TaxID=4232 RepID=A0A251VLJ9_HELAN|nr:serine carboxypeptidase-like 40 [Helianthus annuus]KAF5822335.1 putative carboxypeptidase D [Helianthus annuus]KAJ0611830.1 putative carboxypeptidase D [Helianthus annuus]KAJ0623037.1 putative carboxypeptidase D [Helianthus annuus]KAJ0627185.1 putative carboxypeptidase D [Helianthus annuus]KAJ0948315.1 putative carboxypeptidase D [Helianthus annuus]